MSWFKPQPKVTTPAGSPAWSAPLPESQAKVRGPVRLAGSPSVEDRLAALTAFASGASALLAVAVDWHEIRTYPVAFWVIAYTYRYIVPFLWASAIGFGFASRSRILRFLSYFTIAFVATSAFWTRLVGSPPPFLLSRVAYGLGAMAGALLWWLGRRLRTKASA
jgi:hypothetical protein